MDILIKVIQFILSLSLLILIHEFGHFIAAVIFKTRVEKFYMFFNPNFSIFRCKKVHGKWRFAFFSKNVPDKYITHEHIDPITNKKSYTYEAIDLSTLPQDDWRTDEEHTEFGIGWIPLGGYCSIAGMIDESMNIGQMQQAPQPWEFRSKPAWQRLIIMIGGVLMNVLLAYFIYTGLLISQGEKYISTAEVNKHGIITSDLAKEIGLQDGDKILSLDGNYVEDFAKIPLELIIEKVKVIEVERDGKKINIELPEGTTEKLLQADEVFISYKEPFIIKNFEQGSIAEKAGMKEGDRIIGINDIQTPEFRNFVQNISQFANQDVTITFIRENDTMQIAMHLTEEAKIGVYTETLNLSEIDYNFAQAIPRGFTKTAEELGDYWKQVKMIFNPNTGAYKSLGGFISIGNIFPDRFNWTVFWNITALLSVMLAIMNLLPIPALDGGHVLFLLIEMITRRKPSEKFLEIVQTIGLIILLILIIYANGNDIIRWFF